MQHRAADDCELQLRSKDDDSQGKSKAQAADSSEGWESDPGPGQWRPLPWYRRRYNRGTMAAFFCFVLVMASFAIPESAPPLTAIATAVWRFGQSVHQLAKHHAYHAHAHLYSKEHHCMVLPEPLLGAKNIKLAAIAGVCCNPHLPGRSEL